MRKGKSEALHAAGRAVGPMRVHGVVFLLFACCAGKGPGVGLEGDPSNMLMVLCVMQASEQEREG